MSVARPNIRWRGANPNNFTVGRPGASRNGDQTFHHVVGTRESAVIVFNQPTRGASSHFVVGADIIDQCVQIEDTAWCDGNWEHNLRAITVEHEGGQNGDGPYSEGMYENAALLCAWLRDQYGISNFVRHRDVSLKSTACPGGLDVERIWQRASDIINASNQPVHPPDPEWLRNRQQISEKTVYAKPIDGGLFIYNLNSLTVADSRRFATNQNFLIKGLTTVGPRQFYITESSFNTNASNGIAVDEVMDSPYVPPVEQPNPAPPLPTTPNWADSLLVDEDNKTMYILRATPLVDLENGRPVVKDGKEVWYNAGDIIENISAHTIVAEVTYQLTEYSFQQIQNKKWQLANGIKSSDLTLDPMSCPPGTPANPTVPPNPTDPVGPMPDVPTPDDVQNARLDRLDSIIDAIIELLAKILSGDLIKDIKDKWSKK